VSLPRVTLAAEALNIVRRKDPLDPVVAEDGAPTRVAGVLHIHDLADGHVLGRGWEL
jgi:hypothetical protein